MDPSWDIRGLNHGFSLQYLASGAKGMTLQQLGSSDLEVRKGRNGIQLIQQKKTEIVVTYMYNVIFIYIYIYKLHQMINMYILNYIILY